MGYLAKISFEALSDYLAVRKRKSLGEDRPLCEALHNGHFLPIELCSGMADLYQKLIIHNDVREPRASAPRND
jgi:hypothetical protein